jgi:pyridoxal phosphate enzyme (YggS family)
MHLIMASILLNLQAVHAQIAASAQAAHRPTQAIQLLAVSKTFGADAVLEAVMAGQRAFGENYVQEGVEKILALRGLVSTNCPDAVLEWHFIGPIQSNKTRLIAEQFDWVHSIDREKIAQRLSEQRPAHLPPLNVCLQINISGEASKSGVPAADALALAQRIALLPQLRLRGLMTVPEPAASVEAQRIPFKQVRELFQQLQQAGLPLDTLSMGMSADLSAAVAEGATMVRIGSAIFGARDYAH